MESEPPQRDKERVLILGDLQGEIMVFEALHIKEMSCGGASVETRFPLHLNSLHDLRLELGERSVVVKGRVVHSQIADVDDDQLVYWSGIEFVEPSEHVSVAIADFLRAVRAERL